MRHKSNLVACACPCGNDSVDISRDVLLANVFKTVIPVLSILKRVSQIDEGRVSQGAHSSASAGDPDVVTSFSQLHSHRCLSWVVSPDPVQAVGEHAFQEQDWAFGVYVVSPKRISSDSEESKVVAGG